MAEKKKRTQAEKAASEKNKSKKNTGNVNHAKNNGSENVAVPKEGIPKRVISSVIFLILFILFLVASVEPEGELVKLFVDFVNGIIGQVGFYIAIPAMLYLFYIHAFSGQRPVRMRTVCLLIFIFVAGCLAHLAMKPEPIEIGFNMFSELYVGGVSGVTGGVLCGGFAILLQWLCGPAICYIIFIVTLVFLLLAGMQITIPSIIRAVQNRPRLDWEEEEKKHRQEPAAVVVNHIVNKQNEHKERRRLRAEQMAIPEVVGKQESIPYSPPKSGKAKVESILSQIDVDVEAPVAVAAESAQDAPSEPIESILEEMELKESSVEPQDVRTEEEIPETMPELNCNQDQAPVAKERKVATVTKKTKAAAKDGSKNAEKLSNDVPKETTAIGTEHNLAYCFPPIDLLTQPEYETSDGSVEMRENTKLLNESLSSFKIEARITNVTRGPSVTRYDAELAKGVRLSKLTSAADDIALSLGATGVRIAAVPGKISVVGIEVPNRDVNKVALREVIGSHEFEKAKSKSSFAVGKDISGSCVVGNIAKLPHMLIAGTTGSGKSVCMNSIIISLLYKASPDDVKLIMIDPKMVELGIYNGIPHLLIPVVTDPKKAAGSLQWAVTEMMRRYKAMSDVGVRDIESYNSIIESQEVDGSKLPQVVVIIDELADLMLVAAKEVEESICRIAQMGRAAGIHLVIATQRPSADVITGLMKANIPSRIAFSVASAMESRIILDTPGAEKLVGKGDMLYAPIGTGKPRRVQGCFVSDEEVEAVASYVKEHYNSSYDQEIMDDIEKKASQTGSKGSVSEPDANEAEMEGDEMLPAAVDVILETGQASVSMLQRRLKLGYARAARIVDEMEERGIVGPFVGSKPRAILVTKSQWEAMRTGGSEVQMEFSDYDDCSDFDGEGFEE